MCNGDEREGERKELEGGVCVIVSGGRQQDDSTGSFHVGIPVLADGLVGVMAYRRDVSRR